MAEIKIKQTEKNEDQIDFNSLEKEVVKEKEEIKIKAKEEAAEKKEFHFDKKLWTGFGIAAVVIIAIAVFVAFVAPNFLA